ncbi:MAG: T9SS type A sorting domain-containing protein [Bacteroidales bacterium]|nr:T9SS type A sorting domain-containing protein [Bacteroidales bacterium]
MKRACIVLLVILANSSIAQNIWEPIPFPDSLVSVDINAEKEGVIFVATGYDPDFRGLFRSVDEGLNWDLLSLGVPYQEYIYSVRCNPEGELFVGTGSGIYRSFDDGNNFERVFHGGFNIVSINFSPSGEIYAGSWSNIFRSSDDGYSWDTLYFGGNIYFADIDFGPNGEIYTVGISYDGQGTGSGFNRSLDHGETWENIGITDEALFEIEVNSMGVILVGGLQSGVYISQNRGESFTFQYNSEVTALETDSQDHMIAGVTGYQYDDCLLSEDWGNTWASLYDTVFNPYINQISISPDNTVYLQCHSVSSQQYQLFKSINPILGIDDEITANEIIVFPNPADNIISLTNCDNAINNPYVMYNQYGQEILSGTAVHNSIDVSMLKPELYILEFEIGNKAIRKKVLIK